jgi:hypothetical protein
MQCGLVLSMLVPHIQPQDALRSILMSMWDGAGPTRMCTNHSSSCTVRAGTTELPIPHIVYEYKDEGCGATTNRIEDHAYMHHIEHEHYSRGGHSLSMCLVGAGCVCCGWLPVRLAVHQQHEPVLHTLSCRRACCIHAHHLSSAPVRTKHATCGVLAGLHLIVCIPA